jgi:hypothetical protein
MRTWPSGQPIRRALAGLLCTATILPARSLAQAPDPAAASAVMVQPSGEPSSAAPQDPPSAQAEALRLFREARVLYTAGKPGDAALAFERSFAAAASPEAAYNAALAHERADDPVATLTWFRRYLEIARKDSDPSYPVALAHVDALRARLGEVRLELKNPDEVREISVNGQPVPLDSFPRVVRPGPLSLRFTGSAAGQVVELASEARAGETATIYFPGFARQPAAPSPSPVVRPDPPPDPTPTPSQRQRQLKIAFWTGVGLTGVGAVLVGVFGGLAAREARLYEDYPRCMNNMCPDGYDYDEWQAHQAAARDYEVATNAAIGVAGGLAVATVALGIAALRETRRTRASTRAGQFLPVPGGFRVTF